MATTIISLSSLHGNNGFRMDGTQEEAQAGRSVSNAGDVNGDGYADVIVSSDASYIVFGKAAGFDATLNLSGIDGSNGFRLDGNNEFLFGKSVSSAGDVNGDGFADVLVGALFQGPDNGYVGSAYVVFGKATSFSATLDSSTLNGSNGFRINGVAAFDLTGWSVSNGGDVNGDGFDDLIVGAFGADPNGDSSGSSYVVFGKADNFDATLNLSSLDGNNGFRLNGVAAYDNSGYSVSSAGDVNGDGFADLLVGAPRADSNGNYSGSSYVVFGKASGFDAVLNLSSLDGSNGFRMDGPTGVAPYNYSFAGQAVSNAGDVNGDGFADVIIGTYRAGSKYVVFGKASGFDATLNLTNLDGVNGFRLDGADTQNAEISSAGDVNGDGYADLIIGSEFTNSNGTLSGSSYVVFGKALGFSSVLDLSSLDSNSGFRLDGAAAVDLAGTSVSAAGDVNSDGFTDLLIGAPDADPNGNHSGSSYVVFGGNFNGKVTAMGTVGADKLKGGSAVDRIVAGDGNDTLIGRGGADVFHGGGGDDAIEVRDVGFQLVDGGAGTDTLKLDRSNLNLNLADERGRISDIEIIDMKGQGQNTLTLSVLDVLNLSTTSNTLKVVGTAEDHVAGLGSGWVDGGIADGYHTFTNGEGVLLVGIQITTDFA